MLIQELLQLKESVIKAYGTKFSEESPKQLPQFAKTKSTAEALASYTDLGAVYAVELTINKPAKNSDLEALVKELGKTPVAKNGNEWHEYAYAEMVAAVPKVRKALAQKGFDGYADHSVLENTEPMQYVVFSESQVKYLVKEAAEKFTASDEGKRVILKANKEEGWPEERGTITTVQGRKGMLIVKIDDKYIKGNDDGIREIHQDDVLKEAMGEPSDPKWKFLQKIREKQAESGKYTDAQMEKSYVKLMKLDLAKLEELSKMNVSDLKKYGY